MTTGPRPPAQNPGPEKTPGRGFCGESRGFFRYFLSAISPSPVVLFSRTRGCRQGFRRWLFSKGMGLLMKKVTGDFAGLVPYSSPGGKMSEP
jgi:hypothetical protein